MNGTRPAREAALFLQLVLGLQQSAMIALGKLMNPLTRKVEVHLDAARDTIDTLGALEARTRGNLEPEEARALQQVLADLRLNYVDEVKKSGEAATAGAEAKAGAEGEAAGAARAGTEGGEASGPAATDVGTSGQASG